jgi:hypothetical protein
MIDIWALLRSKTTDGAALKNILSNVSNKITNVTPHSVQPVEQNLLKNNDD